MNHDCKCWEKITRDADKGKSFCSVRQFDAQDKLVFAICKHGEIVLDLRPNEPGQLRLKDRDAHPESARKSTLMKR